MLLNSAQAFFQALFSQLFKLSTFTVSDGLSFAKKCISAVQIYEFHIFISEQQMLPTYTNVISQDYANELQVTTDRLV